MRGRKVFILLLVVLWTGGVVLASSKFMVGDKVKIYWINRWHVCTILEVGNGKYKVHFEDDDRIFDRWIDASKVFNFMYKVGDSVLVLKDGKWLPATVIAGGTLRYKIHYIGKESTFDEWVGPDRIKEVSYKIGEKVKVFWQGDWFDAKIIGHEYGKYKVHLIGFPKTYDQWVTIDKIKKQ